MVKGRPLFGAHSDDGQESLTRGEMERRLREASRRGEMRRRGRQGSIDRQSAAAGAEAEDRLESLRKQS